MEEKAMKVIFVYLSQGMNALLPSTGTGRRKDLHKKMLVSVWVSWELTKEKASTSLKMIENR